MDKKIKTVKLKNDYRDEYYYHLAGESLQRLVSGFWQIGFNGKVVKEDNILEDTTNLFAVEYEPETETKSITVKIEYESWENDTELTVELIWEGLKDLYFKNAAVNVRKI